MWRIFGGFDEDRIFGGSSMSQISYNMAPSYNHIMDYDIDAIRPNNNDFVKVAPKVRKSFPETWLWKDISSNISRFV